MRINEHGTLSQIYRLTAPVKKKFVVSYLHKNH